MEIWRICKQRNADDAFSGRGSEKTGGRWNSPGVRVVYTSQRLSLAVLELFVHVDPVAIPDDLVSIWATLPDDTAKLALEISDLPRNWRNYPAPPKLQRLGSEWVKSGESPAFIVPSAINQEECNVLLNPLHPEIEQIQIVEVKPFHFDPRMFGK